MTIYDRLTFLAYCPNVRKLSITLLAWFVYPTAPACLSRL